MTPTLPDLVNIHRCSILDGVLSCERVGCDFRLHVASFGHARAVQIGHAHVSNPRASKLELLEFVSLGIGGAV